MTRQAFRFRLEMDGTNVPCSIFNATPREEGGADIEVEAVELPQFPAGSILKVLTLTRTDEVTSEITATVVSQKRGSYSKGGLKIQRVHLDSPDWNGGAYRLDANDSAVSG